MHNCILPLGEVPNDRNKFDFSMSFNICAKKTSVKVLNFDRGNE